MHTVVAAALYRGGEVLLCHRAPTRRWYPNVWDFPGGHVEGGESPRSALVREVIEELAVDLSQVELPFEPHYELFDGDLHLSIWRINGWTGDPQNVAPDEHDTIGWFTLLDALTLPLAHLDYPALLTAFDAHLKAD